VCFEQYTFQDQTGAVLYIKGILHQRTIWFISRTQASDCWSGDSESRKWLKVRAPLVQRRTHTHISLAWFKACVCVLRARRAISKQCAAFVGRSLNGWMPLIMPLLSPFNCLRDAVGRKCFSADFLQTSLITFYCVYAIHMRHLVYLTFHIEWCACQQSY
jgi:hypothetical protein